MNRSLVTVGLGVGVLLVALLVPALRFTAPEARPDANSDAAPSPTTSGSLTLSAGLDIQAVPVGAPTERMLVVRVHADDVAAPRRDRPVAVAVALDASGSMATQDKMTFARQGASLLARGLTETDTFALVRFSDDATVVLPAERVTDPGKIERAIARVLEGGGTNVYAGVSAAADQVADTTGAIERVVLLSDGNANVGQSSPEALVRLASLLRERGVTLSAVGLGLDYNEDVLTRIADAGGGTYDFVDDPTELAAAFQDELTRATAIVGQSVRVSIELPPGVEGLEVLGWSAERTARGWSITIGDLDAGQSRLVVARVRLAEPVEGTLPVASIDATWTDVPTSRVAGAHAEVSANGTHDASAIAASVDGIRARDAARVSSNTVLDRSTRAYADGRVTDALSLVEGAAADLDQMSVLLADPSLAAEARILRDQTAGYGEVAPASAEGQRAIKTNKEASLHKARGIK